MGQIMRFQSDFFWKKIMIQKDNWVDDLSF